MTNCEHEINISETFWTSDEETEVVAQCEKCNKKFRGKLK